MKTKKKKERPIEIDAHFKYRCSNEDCGCLHWLSLKEVQTQNFKIVCDCGNVFKPKRIKTLEIIFDQTAVVKTEKIKPVQQKVNFDLIKICVNVLVGYGFTDVESEELLIKCHKEKPDLESADLIKFALQSFGG
jgi:hypothetical protein